MERLFWRRLLGAGSVVIVLSAVAVIAHVAYIERQAATRGLVVTARLSAEQIHLAVEKHLDAVATLAGILPATADWEQVLEHTQAQFDGFLTMLVVDESGLVIAGVPEMRPDGSRFQWAGVDVNDREYFQQPLATRQPHVSGVFLGRGYGNDPLLAVSAPLLAADGSVQRVLQGSIGSKPFAEKRAAALRTWGQSLLVVDSYGKVIFASQELRWDPTDTLDMHLPEEADLLVPGAYRNGGDARAGAVRSAGGWSVLVLQPVDFFGFALRRHMWNLLLPALLGLLAFSVASALLARHLAQPIRRLAADMRSLGSFEAATPRERPLGEIREINELEVAFQELLKRLGAAHQTAQQALADQLKLRTELESTVEEQENTIKQRTEKLRVANERLRLLTLTDELTGALNYRGCMEAIGSFQRTGTQRLVAIACDVDLFKNFNDHYGHLAGDGCLRRVASALRSALLQSRDVLCRVGGEEFVALVPDLEMEEALAVAERMREAVGHMAIPHEASPIKRVTVSVGFAIAAIDAGFDPKHLLDSADQALYRAKRAGRDRVSR